MASIASIPPEILVVIFTFLQCFTDLASAAGVCRGWRTAVHSRLRASQEEEPRYRQLPWLLQPSFDEPPSTITSFVSGTTGRRIRLPGVLHRRDRFCGSHEGGWVAVAAVRGELIYYGFVNLIEQAIASISLPSTVRSHPRRCAVADIRMVTLSDVPTAGSCIAAAHTVGGYPSIIFCRPHVDDHWVPPLMDTELLQDTLYHSGEVYQGFYSISNRDNLYVFVPREANDGETLVMRQVIIAFAPALTMGRRVGGTTITRYLVESRGKLLVVLRYSGTAMDTGDLRTLYFRVFEMELNPLPDGGGHATAWVELDGLDGRVITLARGCSRAFEAGQYRGFEGGSIYYLDDAAPCGMYSIFSFADLGMYSMGDTKIERPRLPTPALPGPTLDGDGDLRGRPAPRHPSQPQATEPEVLRWLFRTRSDQAWDGRGRPENVRILAGSEPASSNSLYGPRELMVHTIRNVSHATQMLTSRLKIVSEFDHSHLTNDDEASSSTSAGWGRQVVHETVASVWPLLCKPGNRRSIWFLPPSADEFLLPPPPPADA